MPFQSIGFRVLIASPSDLTEERKVASSVAHEWNAMHAVAEGVTLLPVMWETHAVPQTGIRPQEAINQQLVKDSDLLIGMFWTKLGSSTGVAESGTVEEIDQIVAAAKPAMLYFSSRHIDPNKIDADQHQKLTAFKSQTYKNALVGSFTSLEELRSTLLRDLTHQIRRMKAAHGRQPKGAAEVTADEAEQKRRAVALNDAFVKQVSEGKFDAMKGKRGIAAVSIIPLNRPSDPLEFGRDFAQKFQALFKPLGTDRGTIRSVADGMVTRYYNQPPAAEPSLAKITEWGEIFAANHWLAYDGDGDQYPTKNVDVPIYAHEPNIIAAVHRYFTMLNQLAVKGPWWVSISLVNAKGLRIIPDKHLPPPMLPLPITEATVQGSCRVDEGTDLSIAPNVASAIRKALDRLWRGFNAETTADPYFADNNTYIPRLISY